MAGPNDFYISFGSNADQFSRDLASKLAPARKEITAFQKDLAALGQGPAGSALGRLLQGMAAAGRGGAPAAAAPAGGPSGGSSRGPDFERMAKEAASYSAEMDGVLKQIVAMARGLEALTGAVGKATTFQSRSAASKTGEERRYRDADTGRRTTADNPRAVAAKAPPGTQPGSKQDLRAREKADRKLADRVTIAGTPKVMVDDAAFKRVVNAIEKQTNTGKDIRRSVDKLYDLIDAQGRAAVALRNDQKSGGGGGRREGGKKKDEAVDPAKDAAFTRVSELRANIARRERLAALQAAQQGLAGGGKLTGEQIKAAAGGSRTFGADIRAGKTGRIDKAIAALQESLKGVPKLKALEAQLAQAITATGTADGKRTGAYADIATARRNEAKSQTPTAAPPRQARDTSIEAIRSERDASVAQLREVLANLTNVQNSLRENGKETKAAALEKNIVEITKRIAELEKPLRRDRKAANRSAAAEKRKTSGPSLSQQERADQARDIALAGDETALRDRVKSRDLTKADLRRIAGTFTKQGYDTPFNTKTSNEGLISGILASRKQYEESGRVTAQDLTTGSKTTATEVSKGVRKLIKSIVKAAKETAAEEFARDIVTEDRLTGGTGVATQSRSGKAKRAQYPGRGAAFGGRGDDIVTAAEGALKERRDRISEASLRTAGDRLRANPNFNPYDPKLRAGVTGKGPEAREARAALSSLIRSIEAIDKQLDKAALSPALRAGVENRKVAREAFNRDAEARDREHRERSETQYALRSSAQETLFQGGTTLGSGRQNASLTRLFPGINVSRRGVLSAADSTTSAELYALRRNQELGRREGPIAAPNVRPFSPESIKGVQKAYQKYLQAFQQLARLGDDRTPEQLQEAQRQLARGMHRFIEQYEKAAQTTLRTSTETHNLGYDPALGYGETYRKYGVLDQRAALAEDKKVDAASRARARAAGPDPKILKQVQKNAQSLARRIGAVQYKDSNYVDAKGNKVDINDLQRQYEAAIRPLIVALEKELARAEKGIQRHSVNGAAPTDPKALANYNKYRKAFDTAQGSLDQLQPRTISKADEAARAKYLDARRIQQAKFNAANDKYVTARREAQELDKAGKPQKLTQTQGKALEQDMLYQEYLLGQIKPPRTKTPTKAQQLGGLQRAANAYAAQTTSAYDATRNPKPPRAGAGGGGGGGTSEPPVPGAPGGRGAGGGSSNSLLQRILAELIKIHAVVNAGVKVNHTVGRRATTTRRAAPTGGLMSWLDDDGTEPKPKGKAKAATPAVPGATTPPASATGRQSEKDAAKGRAASALSRAYGGYDPALGYGTMRSQEQAAAKAAESSRANARAQVSVADTARKVGTEVQKEVAALRALIAAGASSEKVAQQQVVAYRALNNALQGVGVKGPERAQRIAQVFRYTGAPSGGRELEDVRRAASLTGGSGSGGDGGGTRARARRDGDEFGTIMGEGAGGAFQRAFFGNNGFASRVVNSVGTFLVRNASAGIVFGLTNALQDAIGQGVETESTFVRVSEALDKTGRSSAGLRTSLSGLSEEYGVALKDVYTTTAGLTGLFDSSDKNNEKLLSLTRVAVQLQLISGGALNATEAMKSLSSITAAYGEVSVDHIADVAAVIQNQLGVNIEETIEGVARLSGQTKVMGIDFEHAAAYVAAISKLTNQTGAASGEQFSRILASLQGGKTQTVVGQALGNIGVDVKGAFQARDYQSAIDALLGSYTKLSKAEQARVSTQIGGARQAASINALLSQGAKVLNVEQAAMTSNGAANERAAKISEQLAAQLNRTRQAFVNFIVVLVRSGVLNAVGVALEVILRTLGLVNAALNQFNDLIDSSGFLSTVRTWGFAIAGLAVGFVLARKAAAGLLAVMRATLTTNTAASAVAAASGLAGAAPAAAGGAAAAGAGGAAAAGAGARGAAGRGVGAAEAGILALLFGRRKLATDEQIARQQARYVPRAQPTVTTPPSPADTRGRLARFVNPVGPNANVGRFGAVDQNGVPLRATQRFYARQAVRADNIADSARQRAAAFSQRAAQASAGASYGSGLGYGGAASAAANNAAALASKGVAGTASLASRGFAAMARNVSAANVAMAGITFAAVLMINGIQSFNETTDQYKAAYKAAFNPDKQPDQKTDSGKNESAFQAILDKNKDENTGFSGLSRAFVSTIKNPLTLFNSDERDRQANRDTGFVENDDWSKLYGVPMTRMYQRLGKAGTDLTKVNEAISANQKDLIATAKKVNSSNLSSAQKTSLLADLSKLQGNLNTSATRAKLAAQGINKLNVLTQDQLEGFGPLVQALMGFSTTVQKNFAPLLQQYLGTLGLDAGSDYTGDLKALARGAKDVKIKVPTGREDPKKRVSLLSSKALTDGQGNPIEIERFAGPNGEVIDPKDLNALQRKELEQRKRAYYKAHPNATSAEVSSAPEVYKTVPLTQEQKSNLGTKLIEKALTATQAQIAALPEGEEKSAKIQAAIQLAGTLDQVVQTRLQRLAADAQALTESARFRGDYSSAAANAQKAISAAQASYKEGSITKAQLDQQTQQIQGQAANDLVTGATQDLQRRKASTRNSIKQAQYELQIATTTLNVLRANGGSADAIQQATIQQETAINALQDAQADQRLAALSTRVNRKYGPSDGVGRARGQLAIALATQRDAAQRFGKNSTQYQQATSGVIDAQRGVTAALQQVAEANSNLAIAYATAGGRTVQAARLQLQAAQRKLREALKNSKGKTGTADVKNAQAAVVSAQAAVRDAVFTTSLDTINFNQQMGYASSAATIASLQNLLKMKNLTLEQRRQVLLQIHQLQQSLVESLTSSGFNIPSLGNVKLPTPYEVRRSLGVDKMQKSLKDAVDLQDGGFSLSTPNGANNNSDMINAIKNVTAAVVAKGAQNIKVDQQNTFTTPTAAAAKAIAAQVIAIINQQNGSQSRATSTTPRTVPTK